MVGNFLRFPAKKLIQSKIDTSTFPPSSITNRTGFTTKDFSPTLKKRKVTIFINCIL